MDSNLMFQSVLEGRSILFLGAGFPLGATNIKNASFKNSEQVRRYLVEFLGEDESLSIEDLSDIFIESRGANAFIDFLKGQFSSRTITETQKVIASLPWRRVYTTNYDDVFEVAALSQGIKYSSITLSDKINSKEVNNHSVIHLNGFIKKLTAGTIRSEIKLTQTSYLSDSIAQSPWAQLFREDVRYSGSVFYLGYTAYDLDIRRILAERPSVNKKSFFYCGEPSRAVERRISRHGTNTNLRTDDFASQISDFRKNFTPDPLLENYEEIIPYRDPDSSESRDLQERDVFNFFFLGGSKYSASAERAGVVIERSCETNIRKALEADTAVAVLHSALGNGKSLITNSVCSHYFQSGCLVYLIKSHSDRVIHELQRIIDKNSRALIVIDNYPDQFEVIRYLFSRRHDRLSVLLTARSVHHDFSIEGLTKAAGDIDIPIVCCDSLSDDDIKKIIAIFDAHGIWGEFSAFTQAEKKNLVSSTCKSQLRFLLLKILNSPQIKDRLGLILNPILNKEDFFEVIVALCIFVYFDFNADHDLIVDACGDKVLSASFQSHPGIRQLVDFENGKIEFSSSITAEYVLKAVCDSSTVIDCLGDVYMALDGGFAAYAKHAEKLKMLTNFSQIEKIIPDNGKIPKIVSYFERIRTSAFAEGNAHYWLQYAIACTTFSQYDRAQQYFDNAKAYARNSRDFRTLSWIDNHYARFLLDTAACAPNASVAWSKFSDARNIIEKQLSRIGHQRENKELITYPYSRAALYHQFVVNFSDRLDDWQLKQIRDAVDFVLSKIASLSQEERNLGPIKATLAAMNDILDRIGN